MQQYRLSTEAIATLHGITLPCQLELLGGYPSVRAWLASRVRTPEGRNKDSWCRTKADPQRLQHVRELNRLRARRYRERAKAGRTLAVAGKEEGQHEGNITPADATRE